MDSCRFVPGEVGGLTVCEASGRERLGDLSAGTCDRQSSSKCTNVVAHPDEDARTDRVKSPQAGDIKNDIVTLRAANLINLHLKSGDRRPVQLSGYRQHAE